MPFNMGFSELLIILVIILLLFGAKRIPEIAGSLGKGISSFKKNINDVEGTFREGIGQTGPLDAPVHRDPLPPAAERPVAPRVDDVERPEPKRLLG